MMMTMHDNARRQRRPTVRDVTRQRTTTDDDKDDY